MMEMNWNDAAYTIAAIVVLALILKVVFKALKWFLVIAIIIALAIAAYFYFIV